jgi:hypothetical protein
MRPVAIAPVLRPRQFRPIVQIGVGIAHGGSTAIAYFAYAGHHLAEELGAEIARLLSRTAVSFSNVSVVVSCREFRQPHRHSRGPAVPGAFSPAAYQASGALPRAGRPRSRLAAVAPLAVLPTMSIVCGTSGTQTGRKIISGGASVGVHTEAHFERSRPPNFVPDVLGIAGQTRRL